MANPYREIFKAEGAFKFSLCGLIARVPMAMMSIAVIAMLNQLGYSYGQASYVAGSYVLSFAICGPYLSRLADRYGQSPIIILGTPVALISLLALIICATAKMALPFLMLAAIGGGVLPNFGAFIRTRWAAIYRKSDRLRTAFALESIFDEIIYMIGPAFALFLTTAVAPSAGALVALAFLVCGSTALWLQKSTDPKPQIDNLKDRSSVLRLSQLRLVTLTLLTVGAIYGAAEIAILAFTKHVNQPSLAGVPLTAYALGSFITGILYGTRRWSFSLPKQLFIVASFAALATLPLFFVTNIYNLTFVIFCAGATCSPTIIISMNLIEKLVPIHKLTESMAWASTGLAIGLSIGAATAGHMIDTYGPMAGFYIAIIMALLTFIMGSIASKKLSHFVKE